MRRGPSTPESSGHHADGRGPGGHLAPSPPPVTSLVLQRVGHEHEPPRPTRRPRARRSPPCEARTTTPSPPKLVLAVSTLPLWNSGHDHHHLPPPQLAALGTSGEVQAAASLARRTLPGDGVPERLETARAKCRVRSWASLAALASTYSRDMRGTRDSRLIEGLTSPGTGGIRV